jgi:uncharacterized membrane protein (DUF4010 family)
MDLTTAIQLATALALGMIIGLERGWSTRTDPDQQGSGGVRNFGLVGLLGAITALLANQWGWGILGLTFLGLALLTTTAYVLTARHSQDYGTTTELALLITFVLGALVVRNLALEAVAAAVVVTCLLRAKQSIQKTLVFLQPGELMATLQVLLIATVALPLLPNRDLGPWQAINPRAVGWLVLLIMGISYGGYFALRLWRNQVGLLLAGLLGGLASSTATTLALARLARQNREQIPGLAAGIVLATGTMAPRLFLEIMLIQPALAHSLLLPLAALVIVPLVGGLGILYRYPSPTTPSPWPVSNPVDLLSAAQYAGLLVLFAVLIQGVRSVLGNAGVYGLAALSGLADVDTVSIALARSVNQDLALETAQQAIFLAVVMNTLVKIALAWWIGGRQLAQWCGAFLLMSLGVSTLLLLMF